MEELVQNAQRPMTNPLLVRVANKWKSDEAFDSEDKCNGNGGSKKVRRKFKEPSNDCKIVELSCKNFVPESKKKIRWAVNMYCDWRQNRVNNKCCEEILLADLNYFAFSESDLAYALSCFIREVRKIDGGDFPPNTLREIIVMIQMYLHENAVYWKILDQTEFAGLRNVLDNTMKQRTAMGLGVCVSSEVISIAHEEKMFQMGVVGDDSPTKLLQTVIYMLGLHLVLRGGVEHCRLRRPGYDCQISVGVDDSNRERLIYREDPLQKNNQGGIGCRNDTKVVYVYGASDAERCPVRLFKKYVRLLPPPKSTKKLYMRPKIKPTPSTWYCDQAYGNIKIASTVKDLCKI